jgi:hypothetical protein
LIAWDSAAPQERKLDIPSIFCGVVTRQISRVRPATADSQFRSWIFKHVFFCMRARAVETVNKKLKSLAKAGNHLRVTGSVCSPPRRGPELEKRALAAVLRRHAKKTRRGKPSPRIMMQERDENYRFK